MSTTRNGSQTSTATMRPKSRRPCSRRSSTSARHQRAARQVQDTERRLASQVDAVAALTLLQRDLFARINPAIVEAYLDRLSAAGWSLYSPPPPVGIPASSACRRDTSEVAGRRHPDHRRHQWRSNPRATRPASTPPEWLPSAQANQPSPISSIWQTHDSPPTSTRAGLRRTRRALHHMTSTLTSSTMTESDGSGQAYGQRWSRWTTPVTPVPCAGKPLPTLCQQARPEPRRIQHDKTPQMPLPSRSRKTRSRNIAASARSGSPRHARTS